MSAYYHNILLILRCPSYVSNRLGLGLGLGLEVISPFSIAFPKDLQSLTSYDTNTHILDKLIAFPQNVANFNLYLQTLNPAVESFHIESFGP
jgi:hypothetical protein